MTTKATPKAGKSVKVINSDGQVKKSAEKQKFGNLPGAGPGRPKGVQNKNTKIVKDMIMAALDQSGGVEYLVAQAKENPKAFLSLLGRIIPVQVTGEGGGPVEHIVTTVKLVPLR